MNKGDTPKTIEEVFQRIMEVKSFKNQKTMIEELDLMPSFYFKIKRGEQYLSDENARKLAELAELPIDYVLIMNNFEKCKDAEAKEAYRVLMLTIAHIRNKGR